MVTQTQFMTSGDTLVARTPFIGFFYWSGGGGGRNCDCQHPPPSSPRERARVALKVILCQPSG